MATTICSKFKYGFWGTKIKMLANFLLGVWGLNGAKICKSCRSRQGLSNKYLLQKICFDFSMVLQPQPAFSMSLPEQLVEVFSIADFMRPTTRFAGIERKRTLLQFSSPKTREAGAEKNQNLRWEASFGSSAVQPFRRSSNKKSASIQPRTSRSKLANTDHPTFYSHPSRVQKYRSDHLLGGAVLTTRLSAPNASGWRIICFVIGVRKNWEKKKNLEKKENDETIINDNDRNVIRIITLR